MALAIRLTRVGRRKAPHYRIVVAEKSCARDGRFVEIIGHYQPLHTETKLEVKEERAMHWLNIGAQPSDTVRSLLRKKGIMQRWHDARVATKKEAKEAKEGTSAPAPVVDAPAAEVPAEA